MIESQVSGREAAGIQFVPDIGGAENTRREPNKAVEHNEHNVQIVEQQKIVRIARDHEQQQRRNERQQAGDAVEPR